MENKLHTLILGGLLLIPTLNFSQTASKEVTISGYSSNFPETGTFLDNAIYSDYLINTSDLIKSNMMPAKLNGGVNSEHPEIGAIVSPDGKTLFFSRYQDPNNIGGANDEEDIWYAEWDALNNKWGEAKNMGAPLNNKYPNFINSISPDGNTLLLGNTYLPNGKMGPGFSISNKTETGWSFPTEIKITGINKQSKWAGCDFSNNQKVLLLAYEQRKNTFGDRDIYVSFIKSDNTWSKPINLGNVINTKGTESSPFLADDDSTLYFTSDGLPGYGGNDIYVSHRLDETWQNWSTPENLGPKVNTDSHQSFFSISNRNIYYSSECESSSLDIFSINLPEIPNGLNPTIEQPIALENNGDQIDSESSGNFSDINLMLSPVLFDFAKSDLKKTSIYELDRIAKILKDSPKMQIEISGHTDNVGSKKYNEQLAQKRIDSILFYLKNQADIDESRIIVKNYGETMPEADNSTELGREQNRRVEIVLKPNL
jgi:outer membrane protein OmpA-like peptidoglycan-associated protein